MAVLEKNVETPLDRIRSEIEALPAWLARKRDADLGPIAIQLREFVDRSEGISADGVQTRWWILPGGRCLGASWAARAACGPTL